MRRPHRHSVPAPFEPICHLPADLVRPVPVDPTGRCGPTKARAAGPRWRRVGHGLYVPTTVDALLPEQRILEATARLPEAGAVTGWAALRWFGAAYFDGFEGRCERPVPLLVGPEVAPRSHPSVELCFERIDPTDVVVRDGVRFTTPLSSLFHELRRPGDWRDAVVAVDMTLAAELLTVEQLTAYVARHSAWRRAGRVPAILRHVREGARSPAEVRLRLIADIDAGLPRLHVNPDLYDVRGRLVCVPDLFDEDAGLVIEYDGAEHRKAARHTRDVIREEDCRRLGLEYCKVTAGDLRHPPTVVKRLLSSRSRARFLPAPERSWTVRAAATRPWAERVEQRLWVEEQLAARRAWAASRHQDGSPLRDPA